MKIFSLNRSQDWIQQPKKLNYQVSNQIRAETKKGWFCMFPCIVFWSAVSHIPHIGDAGDGQDVWYILHLSPVLPHLPTLLSHLHRFLQHFRYAGYVTPLQQYAKETLRTRHLSKASLDLDIGLTRVSRQIVVVRKTHYTKNFTCVDIIV